MSYTLNYHIESINYNEETRVTRVCIVNEDSGEVFYGEATRNPKDKMNIRLATNLATARAVRQAINSDLNDCEHYIEELGDEFQFDF